MKHRGYTLVELLVVVAIIAILAAMIAPVLMQAKEAARMRTCAENMRQLGFAITRYIDDNNGYGLPVTPPAYETPWILCIEPLIPNYIPGSLASLKGELPTFGRRTLQVQPKHIWVCPGDINRGGGDAGRPYWWHSGSSYLYPGPSAYQNGTDPLDKSDAKPRKPMTWCNHRRDILLADFWYDFHSGQKVSHKFNENPLLPAPTNVSILQTKSMNVLFLDLHLKACTAGERKEYMEFTKNTDNPYKSKK
ncbi:MAG: prepilin-type N-terminal cleavage/methylation domain-containing protein [Armatimonadota bacterium]|nr:DUF1559 domain-containing protein [bacterium]